jgi:hypothetical protein
MFTNIFFPIFFLTVLDIEVKAFSYQTRPFKLCPLQHFIRKLFTQTETLKDW